MEQPPDRPLHEALRALDALWHDDAAGLLDVLMEQAATIFEVDGVGLVLGDPVARLELVAASRDDVREVEAFVVEMGEGPCIDAFREARPVSCDDLAGADPPWPRFAARALEAGFRAVRSVPLRLRGDVVGTINLFRCEPGFSEASEVRVVQVFAGAATVAVLEYEGRRRAEDLSAHLRRALDSRVVIEQAKGIVAAGLSVDVDEAFERLRSHARSRGARLAAIAEDVVEGRLDVDSL
jgi:GAF domain-containing protein